MSLAREQAKFMEDLALLILYIRKKGWLVTGGELWRPKEMQRLYYRQGKTRTMKSQHRKKLAIDLNFFKPIDPTATGENIIIVNNKKYQLTYKKKDLQVFGDFWESLSRQNRWGGNWKNFLDTTHFERREKIGKKKK